jgi:hypothetical protein
MTPPSCRCSHQVDGFYTPIPSITDTPETAAARERGFEPEQDENGIDLSHIRANLKLTPRERIEKLERALANLTALRTYTIEDSEINGDGTSPN